MAPLYCANITPSRALYGSTICVDYRTLLKKGAKDKSRLVRLNHFLTVLERHITYLCRYVDWGHDGQEIATHPVTPEFPLSCSAGDALIVTYVM